MNIIGWITAHWRIALATAGVVALAVLLWVLTGWYTDYRQRKVANILAHENGNIANDQIKGNLLEAEKEHRKQEVINAATIANKASDDVTNIRRTDVNKFNANASAVNDRYCRDYPEDCR